MDGGVEEAAGLPASGERQFHYPDEVGASGLEPTCTIERGEFRVVPEARHDLLEALHLDLGSVERALRAFARRCVEQELDVCSHRSQRPPQHHDVRVTVSGGRLTTRTAGGRRGERRLLRAGSDGRDLRVPRLQRDAVRGEAVVDDALHELRIRAETHAPAARVPRAAGRASPSPTASRQPWPS